MIGALDDGYGEQMPLEQVEDIIASKERLIRIQAAERGVLVADWDDVLQEARITIWKVLSRRPNAPGAYLHASTGKRIVELQTRGHRWTGMPSQQGQPSVDPMRRSDRDSFDDPEFLVEATAPELLDRIEWAYHEGEILKLIASLPERHRTYVMLRFWGGLTHVEMAEEIGIKPGNMSRMWNEAIRPVLAERLSHLAGAL